MKFSRKYLQALKHVIEIKTTTLRINVVVALTYKPCIQLLFHFPTNGLYSSSFTVSVVAVEM